MSPAAHWNDVPFACLRLLQEHKSYIFVFLLGTKPECQGQGLGSALLIHLNSIADARGMHCYLEVHTCTASIKASS